MDLRGHPVARSPKQLRLDPAMVRLDLIGATNNLDRPNYLDGHSLDEPILITEKDENPARALKCPQGLKANPFSL